MSCTTTSGVPMLGCCRGGEAPDVCGIQLSVFYDNVLSNSPDPQGSGFYYSPIMTNAALLRSIALEYDLQDRALFPSNIVRVVRYVIRQGQPGEPFVFKVPNSVVLASGATPTEVSSFVGWTAGTPRSSAYTNGEYYVRRMALRGDRTVDVCRLNRELSSTSETITNCRTTAIPTGLEMPIPDVVQFTHSVALYRFSDLAIDPLRGTANAPACCNFAP